MTGAWISDEAAVHVVEFSPVGPTWWLRDGTANVVSQGTKIRSRLQHEFRPSTNFDFIRMSYSWARLWNEVKMNSSNITAKILTENIQHHQPAEILHCTSDLVIWLMSWDTVLSWDSPESFRGVNHCLSSILSPDTCCLGPAVCLITLTITTLIFGLQLKDWVTHSGRPHSIHSSSSSSWSVLLSLQLSSSSSLLSSSPPPLSPLLL